jgi:hypothetical protein
MVQAVINNGVLNLESTVTITEAERDVIVKRQKAVEGFMKDFKVFHTIAATEDGTITSKMGKSLNGRFNPIEETEELEDVHNEFISLVRGEWLEWSNAEKKCDDREQHEQKKMAEELLSDIADAVHKIVPENVGFTLILAKPEQERLATGVSGTLNRFLATKFLVDSYD